MLFVSCLIRILADPAVLGTVQTMYCAPSDGPVQVTSLSCPLPHRLTSCSGSCSPVRSCSCSPVRTLRLGASPLHSAQPGSQYTPYRESRDENKMYRTDRQRMKCTVLRHRAGMQDTVQSDAALITKYAVYPG